MELHVVIGQRKERYDGEYGLEALGVASDADYEGNPDYIHETLAENQANGEFTAVQIIKLTVSEGAVRAILFPQSAAIDARVDPAG